MNDHAEVPVEETIAPADDTPEGRIASLEAALAEAHDKAVRYLAESENIRRRAEQAQKDTASYAVTKFAREMLAVADNLQRALQAAPADDTLPSAVQNVLTGVAATERQLHNVLAQFGVARMDPVGHMFDPNHHRVMMESDSAAAAGTILQVLQDGYVIHDRLLREALVVVAKGDASTVTASVDSTV